MRAAVVVGMVTLASWSGSSAQAQGMPLDPPVDSAPQRVAAPPPPALAKPHIAPVRVALICEDSGRTKVCPAFLQGFIDAAKVMRFVPRADADVVIYVAATQVANEDRVHMRFVSHMPDAPNAIELTVPVDSRGTDDEQRAQIEPAFSRGMALFIAARFPRAVSVAFATPGDISSADTDSGSPWGVAVSANGSGSYTDKYRSASGEVNFTAKYIAKKFRALTLESLSGGVDRQPALTLDDGTRVSLDTQRWAFRFGAEAIYLLDEKWSVGASSYTSFEDPKAQYDYNFNARAALEYDMFPSDDPRGNRLAVFYHLGSRVERYNVRNDIGERFAAYPIHGINAVASVRHDKITLELELESDIQVFKPTRRYALTAKPEISLQLGSHVDFSLTFAITKRELPPPDPNDIDPSDYEQLSRLSYAEPLSISGGVGITIHFDPTNGVRNNRIESI